MLLIFFLAIILHHKHHKLHNLVEKVVVDQLVINQLVDLLAGA
jgi:hypothetical protein